MHTNLLAVGLAVMVSGVAAPQGAVTAVSADAPAGRPEVLVTLRGTNPCGAATIDYGDGTKITHALVTLPSTHVHQYTKAGDYRVTAGGNGNCGGEVSTSIRVQPSHVRAPVEQPRNEPVPPVRRLAALDAIDLDTNGSIALTEWKGTDQVFRALDQNGDSTLSRTEVEDGALDVFASLDIDDDRRVSPREWRTARQSFDAHDRNGDGFVTAAEFGVSPGVGRAGRRGMARGRGMTDAPEEGSNTITVRAADAWTDTGIGVRAGQMLTFASSGTIRMSTNPEDTAIPRGAKSGRQAPNAPLPNEIAGALIGRVGNSRPFIIADQAGPIRMPSSGRLFLGINDDHVDDNSGMFRVVVAPPR